MQTVFQQLEAVRLRQQEERGMLPHQRPLLAFSQQAPLQWPEPAQPHPNLREALRAMQDRVYLNSPQHKAQHLRPIAEGCHPAILTFGVGMVRAMGRMGVPMFVSEYVRSPERQDDLYALGNSRARAGSSPHQYGMALDLIHAVKGWNLSRDQWELIGDVGQDLARKLSLPITSKAWGGEWKFYDPAHWQIDDWKNHKGQFPWPLISLADWKKTQRKPKSA